MVLLKGLHDAFYSNDFPVQSLIITLDSILCCAKLPYHKTMASHIKNKVLQGKSGFPAPAFQLADSKGNMRKNSDYLTNYVYLNFISIVSYTCREELELLKALYEKHKNDFIVVSISIDENIAEVQKYFDDHGYEWDLLSYSNQKELIDIYKVKAFPSYSLIDPEGKLVMSPANSPSENFEWYFFKLLQLKKRNQNR
jgi:peroxiredoxin